MTCAEASPLLDAFVDAELPAPMLLAVARHAGVCPACERAVRELTALHEAVGGTVRAEAEALDLSPVWPAIEASLARVDAARAWRRRLRAAPAWGAALAAAAAAVFWLRTPVPTPTPAPPPRVAVQRPNHLIFDRLEGDVRVHRARKDGMTVITVAAGEWR
jgi:anti-sigma factor RsiW